MPTIYPIDSYQEKEIGVWLNNKPLYQTDMKINTDLSESPAFFDTENIFNQLDYLTNIEGISFSSESNKYITYSDKTYDATLSYDRETHYIKLDFIGALGTLSNTTITFYYTKTSTNRLKTSTILEQSGDYYPVMDVKVNGDSVIDGSRVAQIKSYKEVTQEEYNALPDSKKYDGIMYCIIDSTTPEDKQVIDIQLDGISVVDKYGVANLQGLATAVDLAKKQNLLVAGSNVTLVPLSDGTVQINASGSGGSVSGVTDVIVNGSSVVTNNVAVFTVPTSIPTKTSDLFNDSGYINKEVNNLTNYYTKAQTNNKIEEEIDSIPIVTNQDKGLMSPALKSLAENAIQDVKVNDVSVVDENGIANIYGGVGEEYLSNLSDVELTNLQDGQGLLYDSTLQKWINTVVSGSGNVDDVVMNGQSIVTNKVASFNNYVELTRAEWEALPDSKYGDGILYCIKDSGSEKAEFFYPIIYSLAEREIGVWVDGKPLYQKSYQISNFTYNDWVDAIDVTALNIDRCCKAIGSIKRNNTNGLYISFDGSYYESNTYTLDIRYYNGNIQYIIKGYNDFTNMIVTLFYTKTTDNPGTGKWTTSGVPAHHYSTDEQVIGTWIDGKTLYEKTFVLSSQLVVSYTNWTQSEISTSGIDLIIDVKSVDNVDQTSMKLHGYNDNGYLYLQACRNSAAYIRIVTIQYTKSS